MPIYDYLCASCRHRIEVIHGIHEAGPRFCPSCGEEGTMRKALVSPAVHFKGSGWAKKDRSSPSGTRARSGSGPAAEGGSGNGGTGDGSSSDAAGPTEKDAPKAESGTGPSTSTTASED